MTGGAAPIAQASAASNIPGILILHRDSRRVAITLPSSIEQALSAAAQHFPSLREPLRLTRNLPELGGDIEMTASVWSTDWIQSHAFLTLEVQESEAKPDDASGGGGARAPDRVDHFEQSSNLQDEREQGPPPDKKIKRCGTTPDEYSEQIGCEKVSPEPEQSSSRQIGDPTSDLESSQTASPAPAFQGRIFFKLNYRAHCCRCQPLPALGFRMSSQQSLLPAISEALRGHYETDADPMFDLIFASYGTRIGPWHTAAEVAALDDEYDPEGDSPVVIDVIPHIMFPKKSIEEILGFGSSCQHAPTEGS